jgi:hypothetical protein
VTDDAREIRRKQKLRHAMDVLIEHRGVVKSAAYELGVTEKTLREQITEFCASEGYVTLFEAGVALGRQDLGVNSSV